MAGAGRHCSILSSTDRMLRQISGTEDLGALAMLGKITSPEGVGTREQMNRAAGTPSTQSTSLVKLTDAVVPDPPFRRQFAALVDQLLGDAPKFAAGSDELAKMFQQWREMGPGFAALAAAAPVLNSASSRVQQLQKLGSAGLEALDFLRSGKTPPGGWKDTQLALIHAGRDAGYIAIEAAVAGIVSRADSGGCECRRFEGYRREGMEAADSERSRPVGARAEVYVVGRLSTAIAETPTSPVS